MSNCRGPLDDPYARCSGPCANCSSTDGLLYFIGAAQHPAARDPLADSERERAAGIGRTWPFGTLKEGEVLLQRSLATTLAAGDVYFFLLFLFSFVGFLFMLYTFFILLLLLLFTIIFNVIIISIFFVNFRFNSVDRSLLFFTFILRFGKNFLFLPFVLISLLLPPYLNRRRRHYLF
jgi:hypothetical protein